MTATYTTTGPQSTVLVCQRCGHTVRLVAPLPLHVALGVIKAFTELHQYCFLYAVFLSESEDPNAACQ